LAWKHLPVDRFFQWSDCVHANRPCTNGMQARFTKDSAAMTDSQKTLLYRSTLITILLVAVYYSTFTNRFVWDDLDVIVKNRLLENFTNLPKLFLYEDRTADALTGYYRPVTYISFLLDRSIWGLNPVGFNITNLILHIAAVLLFYRVLFALFNKERLAFVAALLFALHPVAVESVNFHAGGRNTLLSACFALLALLLYINKRWIPAVISFTLAIFSKEFALLLPLVLIAYDRYIGTEKRRWPAYLPYLVSIVCYLTLRSFAVAQGNLLATLQLSDNLLLIPKIVVSYLKNMLFPVNLKVIYDVSPEITASSLAIYSLLLIAGIGAAVTFRRKREIAFSSGWFFLFLLPVTGIVPLGTALIADRYAYFSLMGFSLALAYAICLANKRVVVTATVLLSVMYAAIDLQRNPIWKNMPALYTQMTIDAPERSIGFTNLGMYYYEKGDLANAERYLEESCSKKGIVIRDAYQYLSAVYWEGNKFDKALAVLNKLMTIEPGNPQPYIMASKIYASMGDKAMAQKYYETVTSMFPQIEEMMAGRVSSLCQEGEKLMAEGRINEAERKFKEALMMKSDSVPALIDMGSVAAEKGNLAGAVEYFSKAVTLAPLYPQAHYNLSMAYELMGRQAEAAVEMKRYKELDASPRQSRQ
jgi:protein O-mannosyl-transferase